MSDKQPRGPYKKYLQAGSSFGVHSSTLHRWRATQRDEGGEYELDLNSQSISHSLEIYEILDRF